MTDNARRDDDVELCRRARGPLCPKRLPQQWNVAEQGNFRLRRQDVFLSQTSDDKGFAISHGRTGLRFPLADGRITLAETGHARHHAIDLGGDIAIRTHTRRYLQSDADIDVLDLLRNTVHAR